MIKMLNPEATFRIVSQTDDAIEFESSEELEQIVKNAEQTRSDVYLKSFDVNDLKFKPASKPTIFVIRCLKSDELASLNEKYISFNAETKKVVQKNSNRMFLDIFEMCVLGYENESGKVEKISKDNVPFNVCLEIGSIISLMTTVGHNLKKQ